MLVADRACLWTVSLLMWWESTLCIRLACFSGGQPWRVMMRPLLSVMIRPLTLGTATGEMRGAYNAGSPWWWCTMQYKAVMLVLCVIARDLQMWWVVRLYCRLPSLLLTSM